MHRQRQQHKSDSLYPPFHPYNTTSALQHISLDLRPHPDQYMDRRTSHNQTIPRRKTFDGLAEEATAAQKDSERYEVLVKSGSLVA